LEEILGAVRDEQLALSPELFALLFATADAIEEAGMRLREQQDLNESPLAALLGPLERAACGAVEPLPSRPAAPPAPKPEALPSPAAATAAPSPSPSPPPTPEPNDAPETSPPPHEPASSEATPPRPPGASAGDGALDLSAGGGSVRVPAEKLDTLLARIGELLVARRRIDVRVESVTAMREAVTQWKKEWRRLLEMPGNRLSMANGEAVSTGGGAGRVAEAVEQAGNRLRQLEKDLDGLADRLAGDGRALDQVVGPLGEEVRRVRMLPFAEACQGLDRNVRDLAQAGGKDVALVIEGGDVEMDRAILEGLKDPLRHLVRNAVDHGTQTPAQRRAAGKPPQARVTIAAALRGAQVEVTVKDDGTGLDLDALREQARRRKLPEPADEGDLARLVFLPGLSTAKIITDVSGRGVGLDVVKSRVEALHGTVDLTSVAGQGTRFTLTVPLTLTTLRAVLVRAAGETFAFAGTNVQRFVRAATDDLRCVAGRQMLALGGTPLPLASLAGALGRAAAPVEPAARQPILVLAAGEKRMAFAVDELLAEQEIVVKSLGPRIRRMRFVSGATLLPSGRIALVLNAANLIRSALASSPAAVAAAPPAAAAPVKKRLLVVDDSVTTRTLEKSILESAGFEVATAVDGRAAWQLLQEQGADLLVSDVDMPNMDGFELTEAVRGSPQLKSLPIILVTARESDADKARGIQVGADAYLVKSAFDQRNLLETIAQLL
jgi:two-component system chemotaxis sensor kinase CheA